jgi:predicted amidohydrolase YtcJ
MRIANTKALAIAGFDRNTSDPPNGHIMRNAKGDPTGELKESAQRLVEDHIPPESDEDVYQSVLAHMDEAAAAGLTSVQNASWTPKSWPAYLRAASEGKLKLRFRFAPIILPKEGGSPEAHKLKRPLTADDLAYYRELRDTFRGPYLQFGAIKGFLDGTIDAKTAAMFDPYVGGGSGIPFWEPDDLNQTVALYDREGFQIMLHAIGDKAIHMALDAYEYAAKTNGTSGRRHRIEHGELPKLADLPRFKQVFYAGSTLATYRRRRACALERRRQAAGRDCLNAGHVREPRPHGPAELRGGSGPGARRACRCLQALRRRRSRASLRQRLAGLSVCSLAWDLHRGDAHDAAGNARGRMVSGKPHPG